MKKTRIVWFYQLKLFWKTIQIEVFNTRVVIPKNNSKLDNNTYLNFGSILLTIFN